MTRKSMMLGLAVCALAVSSANLLAAADEQYPAANFEPKVTYIDESVAQSSGSSGSSAVDEKYPAANFQPKVTYIDDSAASAPSGGSEQTAANFDPKYPAAYFMPKVIYP